MFIVNELGILYGVTYVDFIADCLRIAAERQGKRVLTFDEFAAMISTEKKSYTGPYMRNVLDGYVKPGRELLEAAARAIDVSFEDCIRLPIKPKRSELIEDQLDTFRHALMDWRRDAALEMRLTLAQMRPDRKPKHGGRNRKR